MRNYDLDFLKRFSMVIAFLAAVTLGLMPTRALLNDANPHLINFYQWLQHGLTDDASMQNSGHVFYRHRDRFNALVAEGSDGLPPLAAGSVNSTAVSSYFVVAAAMAAATTASMSPKSSGPSARAASALDSSPRVNAMQVEAVTRRAAPMIEPWRAGASVIGLILRVGEEASDTSMERGRRRGMKQQARDASSDQI